MKRIGIVLLSIAVGLLAAGSLWYDYLVNGSMVAMLSAFWSAVATVVLGAVAIWQNKQYQALSDQSAEEAAALQQEIRELTRQTFQATEILKQLEVAKYYPLLEPEGHACFSFSGNSYLRDLGARHLPEQVVQIECDFEDFGRPLPELLDKYNSYLFLLKNAGEKTIVDFTCRRLLLNDSVPSSVCSSACDIPPGSFLVVAILNLPPFEKGMRLDLEMTFTLRNLVMETYRLDMDKLIVYEAGDHGPTDISFEFPSPKKISEEEALAISSFS